MSRYTIEMNFAKAKGQAKELDNAAARLERIASGSMEDAMSTISGNWKGENAGNYLRKAEKVQGAEKYSDGNQKHRTGNL